ncbi:MAG: 50S ribosomal protein L25 [Candidatus Omnitrophica bacterium]|nr:50S ribosomal protein L25 [Candidatus Omnitrophota bacterium]
MEEIKLDVQIRKNTGKKGTSAVRRAEQVPAIVYGEKQAPTAIQLEKKIFEKLMRQHHGQSVMFHLNVMEDGKKLRDYSAMLKEEQHDPVSDELIHIDFIRISATHEINAKVQVKSVGEPVGIKAGGSLEHALWEIEVICLPKDLPQRIVVDVSALNIGQAIHVSDLKLPENVRTKHDPAAIVFSVVHAIREEAAAETTEDGPKEPEVTKEKKPAPGAAATSAAGAAKAGAAKEQPKKK